MKVLILTEAGRKFGLGHLTRCTALLEEFKSQNVPVEILVRADQGADWLKSATKTLVLASKFDVVIVDSYHADLGFLKSLAEKVKVPVYFDDYKRLNYPRGIVLNPSIYARDLGYPRNKDIAYLLGVEFFPIRSAFREVKKKVVLKDIQKVLVTMGGSDPANLTSKIVPMVKDLFPHYKLWVVMGKNFKNIKLDKSLQAKISKLTYSPNAQEMKNLMFNADVAISAGGQTLYELARCGVPTIAFCVAENQRHNVEAFGKEGVTNEAADNLIDALMGLQSHAERLKRSQRGMKLVDGKGSTRVVEAIKRYYKEVSFQIRPVEKNDCHDLWTWRNHSSVRKWSFSNDKISYAEHQQWFERKRKDRNTKLYIACDPRGKKLGQVRFDIENAHSLVNVNLNPSFMGQGIGNKVLAQATEFFKSEHPGIREIKAQIMRDNVPSIRAFEKAGYEFLKNDKRDNRAIAIYRWAGK